nr:MAG TPA: Protein of unknown function (DUF2626) [Caudoviricetes sp.]
MLSVKFAAKYFPTHIFILVGYKLLSERHYVTSLYKISIC